MLQAMKGDMHRSHWDDPKKEQARRTRARKRTSRESMTTGDPTSIFGIEIPSADPVFIAVIVGIHIPLGLACVVAGAVAMLSEKRRGRHSTAGKVYYWCLLALFASATFLSVMRWAENYHLFILGALSFTSAWLGRRALLDRWCSWARLHITGMGLSYVLMLIAFYVDNGKQLPLWKDLPHITYWLLPLAVGLPLDLPRTAAASARTRCAYSIDPPRHQGRVRSARPDGNR